MWKKLIFPIAVILILGLSSCSTFKGAADGTTGAVEGIARLLLIQ